MTPEPYGLACIHLREDKERLRPTKDLSECFTGEERICHNNNHNINNDFKKVIARKRIIQGKSGFAGLGAVRQERVSQGSGVEGGGLRVLGFRAFVAFWCLSSYWDFGALNPKP